MRSASARRARSRRGRRPIGGRPRTPPRRAPMPPGPTWRRSGPGRRGRGCRPVSSRRRLGHGVQAGGELDGPDVGGDAGGADQPERDDVLHAELGGVRRAPPAGGRRPGPSCPWRSSVLGQVVQGRARPARDRRIRRASADHLLVQRAAPRPSRAPPGSAPAAAARRPARRPCGRRHLHVGQRASVLGEHEVVGSIAAQQQHRAGRRQPHRAPPVGVADRRRAAPRPRSQRRERLVHLAAVAEQAGGDSSTSRAVAGVGADPVASTPSISSQPEPGLAGDRAAARPGGGPARAATGRPARAT